MSDIALLQELKEKLIEAGYRKNTNGLNEKYPNYLFFNCADSHGLKEINGKIEIQTIGGSRYVYTGRHTVDEAFVILSAQAAKTSEDIDKEYRKIFSSVLNW